MEDNNKTNWLEESFPETPRYIFNGDQTIRELQNSYNRFKFMYEERWSMLMNNAIMSRKHFRKY